MASKYDNDKTGAGDSTTVTSKYEKGKEYAKTIQQRLGAFVGMLKTHSEAHVLDAMATGLCYMFRSVGLATEKPNWAHCELCEPRYAPCVRVTYNVQLTAAYLAALLTREDTAPVADRYLGLALDWFTGAAIPSGSCINSLVMLKEPDDKLAVLTAVTVACPLMKMSVVRIETDPRSPQTVCSLIAIAVQQPDVMAKYIENYLAIMTRCRS